MKYKDNEESISRLKKYFFLKEVDEIYVDEFIDQVIDWIDKDNDPRANGVEDYYYTGPLANPKHYSGMRYFYNISELKPLPIRYHYMFLIEYLHSYYYHNISLYKILN